MRNLKCVVMVSAALTLAIVANGCGFGPNACEKATDRVVAELEACGIEMTERRGVR